jgi:hypothetical protein
MQLTITATRMIQRVEKCVAGRSGAVIVPAATAPKDLFQRALDFRCITASRYSKYGQLQR